MKVGRIYPFVWVSAVVIFVFCGAAIAEYMGWMPEWTGGSGSVMSD
jgi:hypothetical protein